MWIERAFLAVGTMLVSALLTGAMRRFAISRKIIDVPNERSSHSRPTPRSGGVGLVLATLAAFVALFLLNILQMDLLLALAGGGLVVAAVGFLDDRYRLPAGTRLAVHLGAACWALICLGGLPPLQVGSQLIQLGWAGNVLGVLGIVWALNLFNFMDGIDGIAASEAVFVVWGAALLAPYIGASNAVSAVSVAFGAACCGFLLWNWPPAKIFMGDVGSGYIGYVIAVLAVAATRESPVALFGWLILGGVFFVDATLTLLRRLMRREPAHVAHRSHAYQWLARRWGSHRNVTLIVMVVNLVWLFPCALLTTFYPEAAGWIVLVALAPISIAAIAAGAGRAEAKSR